MNRLSRIALFWLATLGLLAPATGAIIVHDLRLDFAANTTNLNPNSVWTYYLQGQLAVGALFAGADLALGSRLGGMAFSPHFDELSGTVFAYELFVAALILLAGEGYVLAMLGTYIQGTSLLLPQTAGATTRWQGYKRGTRRSLQLYALVAAVLAAAAYEAETVMYLMPLVR